MRGSAMRQWHLACALATVGCVLSGCPNAELAPLAPCTASESTTEIHQPPTDQVDLLFVIDDSESMEEEQDTLARELPRMVRVLTSGDADEDGTPDFPPIDLHFGVVSTDLGAHGAIPSCPAPGLDARLLSGNDRSCATGERSFLQLAPGADSSAFDAAVECMVQLGKEGCGLEQPLDAALKSLTSSTSGFAFASGGTGHEDGANAGFLRDSSLLVVVIVSDEDDCSVPSYDFFNPSGTVDLNLRCGFMPEALHPVSRYHDAFRALRPDNPELVLFAAITGVPDALTSDPTAIDYDAILNHPDMVFRQDETSARVEPAPACQLENVGKAAPARRLTELARQFGDQGLVQSICQDDYRGALDAVLRRIRDVIDAVCLPRPLNPDIDGQVECDIVEVLQAGETCDPARARVTRGSEDGRAVCEVLQLGAEDNDTGAGWFYDPNNQSDRCPEGTGQISFTEGAHPSGGSQVRLECRQPVVQARAELVGLDAIGVGCGADTEDDEDDCSQYTDASSVPPISLFCENRSQTCQLACASDANCPVGMMCDLGRETPICLNPTCPPE